MVREYWLNGNMKININTIFIIVLPLVTTSCVTQVKSVSDLFSDSSYRKHTEIKLTKKSISRISDRNLCGRTIDTSVSLFGWNSDEYFAPHIQEAKQRGFTPEKCVELLRAFNGQTSTTNLHRNSALTICRGSPIKFPPSSELRSWDNCEGTIIFNNGSKYIGEFNDGKFNGQGALTFGSKSKWAGTKYVGTWKNNKLNGQSAHTTPDGRVTKGVWKDGIFQGGYAEKGTSPVIVNKPSTPSLNASEAEIQNLQKRIAELESDKRIPPKKSPPPKSLTSGSGFFVSKLGHLITNEHVVRDCRRITVGDSAEEQVSVTLLETDKRNDLALLKISSTKMVSVETKSLIQKLGISIVPLATQGLLRSDDVELGEKVLVAGFPYGDIFSNTIKVTGGMVSSNKGIGDDSGQFQMDAAVQPGNSGGPIYDENGNIVGVVVAQLNKRKFEKTVGSMPENVNFGIKSSTVRQFLTSSGLPTKWSNRKDRMSTKTLAQIGKNQTVMVVCHQ